VDIGFQQKGGKETGRLAVRIHVQEKVDPKLLTRRETFPRRIGDIPVDVIHARYERAFTPGTRERRSHRDPVQPGISVGHPDVSAGTLGILVKDPVSGAEGVLSAAHVLSPPGAGPGDAILQPGPADGGADPDDAFATLGRTDLLTDSAVAWLNGNRGKSREIFGADGPVVPTGTRLPLLGDVLAKSGRSTGITLGRVDGMPGPYGGIGYSFRLVPAPGTKGQLVLDGDSGSVWYAPEPNGDVTAVGLTCMGPPVPESSASYAIASRITVVLARLGVELA
jgi:endonuclease G